MVVRQIVTKTEVVLVASLVIQRQLFPLRFPNSLLYSRVNVHAALAGGGWAQVAVSHCSIATLYSQDASKTVSWKVVTAMAADSCDPTIAASVF
jgi:hypothetical protein